MRKLSYGLLLAMVMGFLGLRAAEQPRERPWFDLDFKGGTPQELVEAMRAGYKKTMMEPPAINVVIPDELAKKMVPAIQMRKVDAAAIFEVLNGIWRQEGLQWVRAGDNVWFLHRAPDRRKTRAFYVGDLLKKFKISDVTTAVEITWRFGGEKGGTKPEMKYHQDTNMLIALAENEQLETVAEVLAQLRTALGAGSIEEPAKKQ